MRCGALLRRIG